VRLNPTGARAVGPARRTDEPTGGWAISDIRGDRTRPVRPTWARVRLALGVLVLAVLVTRVGAGPFLDGLRLVSAPMLLAAAAVTGLTTACCAWRWRLVADALGVRMSPGAALAAVYRAQFLNATLPGGVLGDVDRALAQVHAGGALGPGVRSVVWERTLGQVVQVAGTMAVLLVLPSRLRDLGVTAAAVVVVGIAVGAAVPRLGNGTRIVRTIMADLRAVLGTWRRLLQVVALSTVAVGGHAAVFLLAAHAAGVHASTATLVPLVAVVLLAAAVPANVAGWGPREGVAAWAFGAAGLGMATGVTTAVAYGVMALVATLPGALVLLAASRTPPAVPAVAPTLEEVSRG
jgi:glycosyltransferase 2 family protein